MSDDVLKSAYDGLANVWRALSAERRAQLLDQFKIFYSFNSGNIENPEITYHDTAEIFGENGVSNFTGDVRTIYEINNLKNAWTWLEDALASDAAFDEELILSAHLVLTRGAYDDARWAKGERPGTFKKGDYRVADDVGAAPDEVPRLVDALMAEVQEAVLSESAGKNALTIAAYLHAQLVDIHPFADGNGRTARLLMNYVLLKLGSPPCAISADDRLAYFGALDAFHQEGELVPFIDFCRIQTLKTWERLL
ncbi:Fic family protein [Adlercreutzia sp. R21]|uniref:Fic family protein n=1 Tax=Adlercreutzia wanghongyangiae TaxID=3111451 RepID=UPI002DB574B5|nr:Fic family protein [Adlercreutzia sp. R21]MEC4185049.1 Fic family protein [Adlercreutzia sp. R21]